MPNFRGVQRFSVTLGTARSPSMFLSCGQSVGKQHGPLGIVMYQDIGDSSASGHR